jgi:CAAX prenyl protease-like protein
VIDDTAARKRQKTIAHVAPLAVFMSFLVLSSALVSLGFTVRDADWPWYRSAPEQWIYPLQTLVTLGVLIYFRRQYDFSYCGGWWLGAVMGVIGIVVWLAPGHLFRTLQMEDSWLRHLGFADRADGFDPSFIRAHSAFWYWSVVVVRIFRATVVVALAEELFWRSFLMRFLIDQYGDYWKVPFGKFDWYSLVVVTALFTFEHASVDWGSAVIFGTMMYFVAVRTKSLCACVVMHAIANLLLSLYTLAYQQWGYW